MTRGTFWFRHDYSARNDEKILQLRAKFGSEGYGIFWMLVEHMAESSTGWLPVDGAGVISLALGVPADRLDAIIKCCLEVELFTCQGDRFTSMRIIGHKAERLENSINGKRGVLAKASQPVSQASATLKPGLSKERRGEEIQGKGKRNRDVVKPDPTLATASPEDRSTNVDDATPTPPTSDRTTKPVPEHLVPLAMFVVLRDMKFSTPAECTACIKRHARISRDLSAIPRSKLAAAMVLAEDHWSKKRDYPLRLETVAKFVDDVGTAPMRYDLQERAEHLILALERDMSIVFVPTPASV